MLKKVNDHAQLGCFFAAVTLAILTFLLHGSALQGGWRIDDPWILLYVFEHKEVWEYFFSPGQWRSFGVPFFTPWQVLDFRLDFNLFGLNTFYFYLHHLITIWMAALLTFLLLRRFTGPFWGVAAASLFLAGTPTVVVAQQLMSRHYVTGLVCAILAILCWLRRREQRSWYLLVLASGLYLAAILNKEIYAPLPLILLFLGRDSLKDRTRDLLPLALMTLLFVVWRTVMLGALVGGYTGRFGKYGDLLDAVAKLPQVFFGPEFLAAAAGLLLLLVAVEVWYSPRKNSMLMFAAAVAILLPFLAIRVSMNIADFRFAFLPWWAVCIFLAVVGVRLAERSTGTPWLRYPLFLLPLLVCSVVSLRNGSVVSKSYAADVAAAYDVQGRFIWAQDDGVAYVPGGRVADALQFQYASSLLKEQSSGKRAPLVVPSVASAQWFAGDLPIHEYDIVNRSMRELDQPVHKSSPASDMPVHIRIERRQEGLEWAIEAPESASCSLLFPRLNAVFMIPCAGKIGYEPPPFVRGEFRVFVNSASDRWNVSPMLVFPDRGDLLEW